METSWAAGVPGTGQSTRPATLASSSKQKAFFHLACNKHITCRSIDSASKLLKRQGQLPCQGCMGKFTSADEQQAWDLLQQRTDLLVLHNDYTVTGIGQNPDFTLRCVHYNTELLLVQIDGAQHFDKCMHGTSAEQQRESDTSFDKHALHKGHRVLRVHWRDMPLLELFLNHALHLARSDILAAWILYTPTYDKPMLTL